MAQQILSEEFRRMQKLAGLSEAREEVDLTGSDGKFKAGNFVTYNEKIYMVTGIYPDGTMGLVLANPKTLDPKTRKNHRLDVKISDVKKYTGKNEDIPVQSESLNEDNNIKTFYDLEFYPTNNPLVSIIESFMTFDNGYGIRVWRHDYWWPTRYQIDILDNKMNKMWKNPITDKGHVIVDSEEEITRYMKKIQQLESINEKFRRM